MGSVLMEMGIGGTLVDARHGDCRLQLVEFRGAHGVQLLAAHQSVLCEGDQVVTPHAVGIGLDIEIAAQGRWQQVREPCRLVGALLADEYQDDVIDHGGVEPRRYHAHEPFFEVGGEEPRETRDPL